MITTTFAINPSLYGKLPYDPLRDFAPVTQINSVPNILVVNPSIPAIPCSELIALAKVQAGTIEVCVCRQRHSPHLADGIVQDHGGHRYDAHTLQRDTPAVTDVIAGRVTMLMTTTISAART